MPQVGDPAGWYPDGKGSTVWWDGEQLRPSFGVAPEPAKPVAVKTSGGGRGRYVVALGALLVVALVWGLSAKRGGDDDEKVDPATTVCFEVLKMQDDVAAGRLSTNEQVADRIRSIAADSSTLTDPYVKTAAKRLNEAVSNPDDLADALTQMARACT